VDELTTAWLAALERRHLANLTTSEVARALRALSSRYVERRGTLVEGGALASTGKRAAFALFYGPLHLLVTREILRLIPHGGRCGGRRSSAQGAEPTNGNSPACCRPRSEPWHAPPALTLAS